MLKRQFSRLLTRAGAGSPIVSRFLGVLSVDALVKASGIVLLPLYLTLMSQDEFATYSYLVGLIGVLALVFNFGLYVPQSKLFHDVAEHQRGPLLLTLNVLLATLLALGLAPIYWLGWDRLIMKALFSQAIDYERYRFLVPGGVVLAVYAQMILNYLLTREDIRRVQGLNVGRLFVGTALTIAALCSFTGDGAGIRLMAYLLAEFLVVGFVFVHYARQMSGHFDRLMAQSALRLGLPIMISGALGIVINFGDKYFIGRYCTLRELSVYFLGLALASVVSAVSTAFQSVWLPLFLKEKSLDVNLARTRRTALQLLTLFGLISLGVWAAVGMALWVGVIDAAYWSVLSVLPIQLVAAVCASLVGLLSSYTIYWSMTYMTIVIGAAVALVSVPMNFLAVRAYGIHGVAGVAVLVNLMYGAAYMLFIRRRSLALRTRLA